MVWKTRSKIGQWQWSRKREYLSIEQVGERDRFVINGRVD